MHTVQKSAPNLRHIYAPHAKSSPKSGEDIPTSENRAPILGEEIPTPEKYAPVPRQIIPSSENYPSDPGQNIPTSEKCAPDLGEDIPTPGKPASDPGQNIPPSGNYPSDPGQEIPTPKYLLPAFTHGEQERCVTLSMSVTSESVSFALAGMASLVATLGSVELPREVKAHTTLVAIDINLTTVADSVVLYGLKVTCVQNVICH